MAYYEDLSRYSYSPEDYEMLNIGFLDCKHSFKRAPVPIEIICRIIKLIESPYIQHRGFHTCEICEPSNEVASNQDYLSAWQRSRSGSSIIKVHGLTGLDYASPSLIVHYITEHQYCPPIEFLESVVGKDMNTYIEEINSKFIRVDNPFNVAWLHI